MRHMFKEAESFNQDIGEWDVSNVEEMKYMFRGADAFNQDLSKWNVWYVEEDIDLRYLMFNIGYERDKTKF